MSDVTPEPAQEPAPEPAMAPATAAPTALTVRGGPVATRPPLPMESAFADLDPERVLVPSRMIKKPHLLHRILARWLFRRVAFEDRIRESLRDYHEAGDIVFMVQHRSRLDYLYFNDAFVRQDLPLVAFTPGLSLWPFKRLHRMIGHGLSRLFRRPKRQLNDPDQLAWHLCQEKPTLLYLKRPAFWPWAPPDEGALASLGSALRVQRARIDRDGDEARPIRIVPIMLVWEQNPDRYKRSIREMVFGDPGIPGGTRKFLSFLANRRRAFIQLGESIDLREALSNPENSADAVARKVRFRVVKAFASEERVIRGPILKRSRRIQNEILRTREFQTELQRLAQASGKPLPEIEKKARRYLKEMAADFSLRYIEGLSMALTLVFDRLYSEVVPDLRSLDRVREASRKGPLILLPCHRSHIDYLVISNLFYANGMAPPHIAAGVNLNFFPIGKIFRRCGAFFIRRSFRGNEVYGLAFREYVRKLVKEGYSIEFFPEGGRSRTGKMLPPRYGLLKIVLDAIRSGAVPDAHLVPIYVGYEQVIEERAYAAEIIGATKKKENITSLLKTSKTLWSRYGRLYVSFAEPISCREALEAGGHMADPNAPALRSPLPVGTALPGAAAGGTDGALAAEAPLDEAYEAFVRRLGYQVLDGIHSVAMVTPTALTAMALLTHRDGISRQQLLNRVGFFIQMANLKKAPLSKTLSHELRIRRMAIAEARESLAPNQNHPLALGDASPLARAQGEAVSEAIDEVLGRYTKERYITVSKAHPDADPIYSTVTERRFSLDFYRNNIVHLFVKETLLAAAIRRANRRTGRIWTDLREDVRFLSTTFKFEFIYDPLQSFEPAFQATVQEMVDAGALTVVPDPEGEDRLCISDTGRETLALLHTMLRPWLEAYWLLARTLVEVLGSKCTEKDAIKRAQESAKELWTSGPITAPEAGSNVTFKQALNAFCELGLVERVREGRERRLERPVRPAGSPDPLVELTERLEGFFGL